MDLDRFDLREEELGLDYCLTFVRDLSASEVAQRLGGTEIVRITGLEHECVTGPRSATDARRRSSLICPAAQ
jgi:hypothetical protein